MFKNIKEVYEDTKNKYKNKIIFSEINREINYQDFYIDCNKIASNLINNNYPKKNAIIFIDKTINCLEAMFSCAFANVCYTVVDTSSPEDRIKTILDTLNPAVIITDNKNEKKCNYLSIPRLKIEEALESEIDEKGLKEVNDKIIDTDPLYILFTSGSTGVPKGTVINHRSVIDYATVICDTFNINSDTIFGSQTPFYFSMSILDIFATIVSGATFNIIPKMYFSFPIKLIEHLNNYKINTIYWVPSALSIVANLEVLDVKIPKYLKTILFAGEVMPIKPLNIWRKKLPNALFANLYGPTEITDTGTYYIVNREFKDTDTLPIGIPFSNCDVLIINDENKAAKKGEIGELLFRGSFLGYGYYNNPEKTSLAFIQNPLNTNYPEVVYKTGDLGRINDYGEIEYLGRKDFQIKHMGYRIELGEIEANINSIDGIINSACIYDTKNNLIVLFYESPSLMEDEIIKLGQKKLLKYMQPNKVIKMDKMPYNANGKIDRVKLKEIYNNKEVK